MSNNPLSTFNIIGAEALPAHAIASLVNRRLEEHATLVVTAPPGAGKSTLLPLTMLQGWVSEKQGKILVLEPRRIAARQIAERMASMIGEEVGQTIGYRIRFESRVSRDTRIEVLTEGILTRMLVDDPTLDGVAAVVFDEFHERSLHSDVALALTREMQQLLREDLRIIIMSATIDATAICQSLCAPLVESQGRMFPVEVIHEGESALSDDASARDIAQSVAHVIRKAHREHEGDILAFLPGEAEIRLCQELLDGALGETRLFPLYGMLSQQEQRAAIAPSREGQRKVVLATPIAETSLTIQGVRIVVDAGLCRKMAFDPQSALSHLQLVRISMDMAVQRTGRAGRVAPGVCYRLWTLATEHRMAESRVPEILEADLSPMVLDIAAWGESQPSRLPWLTQPPMAHLHQASKVLAMLDAIDAQGVITAHGRKLAALPCHPRISQMLVSASTPALKSLAATVAARLEEKDPAHPSPRCMQVAQQYGRLIHVEPFRGEANPYDVGSLLAVAYPERIARSLQEGSGRYRLANGDEAMVDVNDLLSSYDWLAVAHLHTRPGGVGRIFYAEPIHTAALRPLLRERDNVSWDSKQGRVVAQREWRVGQLVVETKPIREEARPLMVEAICQAAQREGTSMLDFDDEVQNLQRRVAAVASWRPELSLPDLSTDAVLAQASDWLPLYLGKATTVAELKKIDLKTALWGLLDYSQQQAVERLAPSHLTVPTGSRIRVEYRQGAEAPILRVRLQECFGWTDTPRVDDGRRPVLMELLSPGFKPVQLTSDLHSFWQNTYFEVRKELRRRYPKHSWPDDPLAAEAVRGVKRF